MSTDAKKVREKHLARLAVLVWIAVAVVCFWSWGWTEEFGQQLYYSYRTAVGRPVH